VAVRHLTATGGRRVVDPDGKLDKEGQPVRYVTYKVVPEQAGIVRRIFEEYSSAGSYKKIAHALNSERVVSPGGKTWDVSAVRTILFNESYRGYRVWNQTRRNKKVQIGTKTPKPREEWVTHKGAHETIVDDDLWEAVQERKGRVRRHIENGKGGYNTGHAPYMLSGLLKCDECGANFSITGAKSRGGARYYRCGYHSNRGESVCGNSRLVRQDRIEAAAVKAVSKDLLKVGVIEDVVEEYRITMKEMQASTDTQDLDKAIRKVEREIANLTASLKALGPTQELVDEMTACQEQRAALESERRSRKAAMPPEIAEIDAKKVEMAIVDLLETLELATPEEKKKLMQANVAEVRIPQQEEPLLVSNPEGLLTSLGCFFRLVTPRGVPRKETDVLPFPDEHRPAVRLAGV